MIRVQNPGGVIYILSVRDDQRIFGVSNFRFRDFFGKENLASIFWGGGLIK